MSAEYETGAHAPAQARPASWAHYANMVLGAWLIAAPFTLGYANLEVAEEATARLAAERDVLALPLRAAILTWSDVVSGVLIIAFAGLSLRYSSAPWAACVVGLWLLFAPLLLWAPTAAAYANDTLVGALVMVFALIIPGVPGLQPLPGPEVPAGWNYNPSSWVQRAPIIALAFAGFLISRYLAAYQLKHIQTVWDPFFADGTKNVLESDVSRAWPVSDAGLGAVSYILEALSGFVGDRRRWRTLPWMVILFGILVVPLGVTSIVLIILQPLAVGSWCTLCLVTAALMLVMISPALDEVIATGQFLWQARREGQPFWRTFWKGGALRAAVATPPGERGSVWKKLASAVGVTNLPWNLVLSAALGVWLMVAPTVLGTSGAAADSNHLVGALVVTVAVIAWGEVARAARFLNILLGAWLVVAPWLLGGGAIPLAPWINMAVGIALILLSLPRGKVNEHFGTWDRFVV